MKLNRKIFIALAVLIVLSITASFVAAEDGKLFRKNISKSPEGETEKAAVFMMDFYVPAQSSDGTVGPVDNYLLADETTVAYEPRDYAKPLISVYIDDIGYTLETKGAVTRGEYDAFVGYSFDDGTTWKTTNLSDSADLSSFTLKNGTVYPGDVNYVVHQVAEDKIFIAWAGKYCEGGTPLYSLDPVEDATYFGDLETTYGKDAVYLYDFFGVAGNQGSVDYEEEGWPEIGEIPYSCVWAARGKLIAGDDPSTTDIAEAEYIMWTKPERLTSGKRDANLPAVDCAKGAGCVLTWQEDPDGLRPGQGLGPGEGWSGAIANAQTDIWYSYIGFEDFDLVYVDPEAVDPEVVPMEEYIGETMPKAYVPMAMPSRITDNAMCKARSSTTDESKQEDPYCYIDFDSLDGIDHTNVQTLLDMTGPEADADYCIEEVLWETPGGSIIPVCKTDDGRVLNGRVAATRVRMNLKPYTKADATGSAWLSFAYEETKALGDLIYDTDGDGILDSDEADPIDIGKDVWYHSFDMFTPDQVAQGGMLNQPAVCKDDAEPYCTGGVGAFYDVQTDELNEGEFYLTEISRRFALTTNSVGDADASESGLSAMLIFKQGIINQGGPADIMLRRVVIPDDFNATVDNPYAFENMECSDDPTSTTDGWAYTDGSNPNYLEGVCLSPSINISGNTIVTCDGATGNDACAALFPAEDDGSIPDNEGAFPKVKEWRQCDGIAAIEGCEDDNDLDDQDWENPFDVAKGHRGYLDKDVVMIMYAWAPNWKSNTVGNDHYNLYVRRSFDGGLTWTTTPASLGGAGVTVTENYYGDTVGTVVPTEWTYAEGTFEQGRNVSLLTGNKITILDPRYSPTGGLKLYKTIRTDWLTDNSITFEGLPYEDDAARDSSKMFIVYETGDNTTVDVGEAIPLDLYYSRGTIYGDIWEVMDYTTTTDDDLLERWPWLENAEDDLSGEASMLANPGGTFMYAVWNQWKEEIGENGEELIYDSDIYFRRLMYLPDDAVVDAKPVAEWLYTGSVMYSTTDDDNINLIGTVRDIDHMGDGVLGNGIDEIKWFDNGAEVTACAGEKMCNIPARNLSNGWHGFSMRGGDNEGNHVEITVEIFVAPVLYKVQLPLIVR
jgi:hypothetical protein